MADVRSQIVAWARWGVENRAGFTYSEGPDRMSGVHQPGKIPCVCDCSAFVTYCYSWAGAPDPNGQGYNGTGYTGTLLSHGTPDSLEHVQPGDVVVYGPGTGDHTALIVDATPDPLTVSMGQQGDPNYCRVSQDGRVPIRFLRFSTDSTNPGPPPVPNPQGTCIVNLRILKQGDTGGDVRSLQRLLHGTTKPLAVDGVFGPATVAAVRQFQSMTAHLAVDGVVGSGTWTSLVAVG